MSNFTFLVHEFETLKSNSVKSESYAVTDPLVSAICSRKALETSVKFMYKIDKDLDAKFAKKNEFIALLQKRDFLDIIPSEFVDELHLRTVCMLINVCTSSNAGWYLLKPPRPKMRYLKSPKSKKSLKNKMQYSKLK